MDSPQQPETVAFDDAVIVSFSDITHVTTQPVVPLVEAGSLSSMLYDASFETCVPSPGLLLLSRESDQTKTYLCQLPTVTLPTYAPLALYKVNLVKIGPKPPDPLPVLSDCLAQMIRAEWQFVSPPLLQGVGTKGVWKYSMDSIGTFIDKKLLSRSLDGLSEHFYDGHKIGVADKYEPSKLPHQEADAVSAELCFARRPQWLSVASFASSSVASALTMRSEQDPAQRVANLRAELNTRPWRLFARGLIDATVLEDSIARNNLRPYLDQALGDLGVQINQKMWQSVASAYSAIVRHITVGPVCAVNINNKDLVAVMQRLGLVTQRATDGAVIPFVVGESVHWLREFVKLLQTTRTVQLHAPALSSSPLHALILRDLLLLELPIPLAEVSVASNAIEKLRSVCVARLSPTDMPLSIPDLQRSFAEKMALTFGPAPACFPLVLVEDLQFWSAHMLTTWLLALLNAPQTGSGFARESDGSYVATGSAALFKLVLCYTPYVEDLGARVVVASEVADTFHWKAGNEGYPMCTLPPFAPGKTALLLALHVLSMREYTPTNDFASAVDRLLMVDFGHQDCGVGRCTEADLPAGVFVVRRGTQSLLPAMMAASVLPTPLLSPQHVNTCYTGIDVVAIERPVNPLHLNTLLSLMKRIIVIV